MCIENNYVHKGIKFTLGTCGGISFDPNNKDFIDAVNNNNQTIFDILKWAVSGGYNEYKEAADFEEYVLGWTLSSAYNRLREMTHSEIEKIKNNRFLSDNAKEKLELYTSGGMPNEIKRQSELKKNETKKKQSGYIYLIVAENGLYKIGRAKSVVERIKPFAVAFPMKWDLVCKFASNNYIEAEAFLHKRYETKREVGEWFSLDENDVEYIKSIEDYKL